MKYDPENQVVKLCTDGMILEGEGRAQEAFGLFTRAWELASDDFEKFTSAHYLARHQADVAGKLKWDVLALDFALKIPGDGVLSSMSSLYLNIGKGYEDLDDFLLARENYESGLRFAVYLPEGGYGTMIKEGIKNGLERISGKAQ